MSALQILHVMAGLVVLAEALNKLERCDPLNPKLTLRERVVDSLKAVAWGLMALGAGGAVAGPVLLLLGVDRSSVDLLMRLEHPTFDQVAVLGGFAVLIVRTRLKEG